MPDRPDPNISYDLDPGAERFFIHVPPGYSEAYRYGLVVYIHPGDEIGAAPSGWTEVLDRRHLLLIAPLGAGNDQATPRRLGLAVLGAEEMMRHYRIDPRRIYAAGWSGGARMAGLLGFFQPDLFHGTIQSCGADFFVHVPQLLAESETDSNGNPYGFFMASASEIEQARQTRFTLITGSRDFRRGNVLDVYNGGFAKFSFHAQLFDIPFMGHQTASAETLNNAIKFIEDNK